MFSISLQESDFDPAALEAALFSGALAVGAIVCFTGYVRSDPERPEFEGLELEHYAGMTESSIQTCLSEAASRWPLSGVGVVHRVGPLALDERIVWVGVASAHRSAAFAACEYIMDILKTTVPLWKRELGVPGEPWVEMRESDVARAARWNRDVYDD
ncbi:MAG: molybdenum cofactor biosynthesis protein MoaE [Chromatocurvus sp.]